MVKHLFLICGFHRSGTSLVAKLLSQLGVPCDTNFFHLPNQFNKSGYFEDSRVIELHRDMLSSVGLDWWDPGVANDNKILQCSAEAEIRIKKFLSTSINQEQFFVKDPQAILFYQSWSNATSDLGIDLHPIFVIRPPHECVDSLIQRDNLDYGHAFSLWTSYHSNIKTIRNLMTFCHMIKHTDLINKPSLSVEKLANYVEARSGRKSSKKTKKTIASEVYRKNTNKRPAQKIFQEQIAARVYEKICDGDMSFNLETNKLLGQVPDYRGYVSNSIAKTREVALFLSENKDLKSQLAEIQNAHQSLQKNVSNPVWLLSRAPVVLTKKTIKFLTEYFRCV